jgi:hypothetical protein
VIILTWVILYPFLNAYRERAGQLAAPPDNPTLDPARGKGE